VSEFRNNLSGRMVLLLNSMVAFFTTTRNVEVGEKETKTIIASTLPLRNRASASIFFSFRPCRFSLKNHVGRTGEGRGFGS